jgi:hypothetical protein
MTLLLLELDGLSERHAQPLARLVERRDLLAGVVEGLVDGIEVDTPQKFQEGRRQGMLKNANLEPPAS